jgi:DNA-binding PadR family transcriptional regulator
MHHNKHHHPCFEGRGRHGHFGPGRFFNRFGAGFGGGPGMRAAKMLASGDLQLIILALLSEKPRYGYEIIKQVEEHSSGVYSPSPGMVYPALTYLEEMGYAASEAEGTKRLYKITEAGTAHLNKNRASVEETLGSEGRRGIKAEWREAKQEFRELRHDLKAAIIEKLDASPEERQRVFAILRRAIDEIRAKK